MEERSLTSRTTDAQEDQSREMMDSHSIPRYRNFSEHPKLSSFLQDLRGWQVLYTNHGNTLLLLGTAGPLHYLDVSGPKFMKTLADACYLNLSQLKKEYFIWTGHRLGMPLPAGTTGDVFVAFKTRQPRMVNDGGLSYIAGGHIADMVPGTDGTCTLVLKSGYEVPVLWSVGQCIQQIRIGGLFLSQLIHDHAIPDASTLINRCQPDPFLHHLPAHRRHRWF